MSGEWLPLVLVAGAISFVAVAFYILIPGLMAVDRNRSGILWILISLVGSPLLAILLLLALGDAPDEEQEND